MYTTYTLDLDLLADDYETSLDVSLANDVLGHAIGCKCAECLEFEPVKI